MRKELFRQCCDKASNFEKLSNKILGAFEVFVKNEKAFSIVFDDNIFTIPIPAENIVLNIPCYIKDDKITYDVAHR